MHTFLAFHKEREWTREEDLRVGRRLRSIAVLSSALKGRHERHATSEEEHRRLRTQGLSLVRQARLVTYFSCCFSPRGKCILNWLCKSF